MVSIKHNNVVLNHDEDHARGGVGDGPLFHISLKLFRKQILGVEFPTPILSSSLIELPSSSGGLANNTSIRTMMVMACTEVT